MLKIDCHDAQRLGSLEEQNTILRLWKRIVRENLAVEEEFKDLELGGKNFPSLDGEVGEEDNRAGYW